MLAAIDRVVLAAATPFIWVVCIVASLALATHFVFPMRWLEVGAGLLFLAFMYHAAYMTLRREGLTLMTLYAGRWPPWIERLLRILGCLVLLGYFLGFIAHADRAQQGIRRHPIAAADHAAEVILVLLPPTVGVLAVMLVVTLVRRRG